MEVKFDVNKDFKNCPSCKISRNALTRTQINDIAMDWDAFIKFPFLKIGITKQSDFVSVIFVVLIVNFITSSYKLKFNIHRHYNNNLLEYCIEN